MNDSKHPEEPVWKRWYDDSMPVKLGVSACLLGGEVRFDGGHKRDPYLTDVLGVNVTWLPVCPEIEMGMSIPRPVIQLRRGESEGEERLVERESDHDWTETMSGYGDARCRELAEQGLDGFVLKRGSPSCGLERVRIYGQPGGQPARTGTGAFAKILSQRLPELPLEEEGRLHDAGLRERFIEAVFSANRWRVLVARGLTRGRLVAFHEAHKMLILAHDEQIYRKMGRVVASFGRIPDASLYDEYRQLFVAAFRVPTSIRRHVNVIEHLFGHVKTMLSPTEKREIAAVIEDYRQARVPLVVVVALLRFLVAAHQVDYVREQLYLDPHPRELMLRNHV